MRAAAAGLLALVALGAVWLALLATMDALSTSGDTDPVFLVGFIAVAALVAAACGAGALRIWRRSPSRRSGRPSD